METWGVCDVDLDAIALGQLEVRGTFIPEARQIRPVEQPQEVGFQSHEYEGRPFHEISTGEQGGHDGIDGGGRHTEAVVVGCESTRRERATEQVTARSVEQVAVLRGSYTISFRLPPSAEAHLPGPLP